MQHSPAQGSDLMGRCRRIQPGQQCFRRGYGYFFFLDVFFAVFLADAFALFFAFLAMRFSGIS